MSSADANPAGTSKSKIVNQKSKMAAGRIARVDLPSCPT
jgi:hypothetical protein